jgi:hypothetical protein
MVKLEIQLTVGMESAADQVYWISSAEGNPLIIAPVPAELDDVWHMEPRMTTKVVADVQM